MVEIGRSKESRILRKLSDAQLRQVEAKLLNNRRVFRDKIDDAYSVLWKLKDYEEHCNYLRLLARTVLGSRKGARCPALGKDKDGRHSCKAKANKCRGYWYREKDHVYQEQCAHCKLTKKTKRNRIVYGQLFKPTTNP